MEEQEKPMGRVIQIDEARIRDHLGAMVRGTVEEAQWSTRKYINMTLLFTNQIPGTIVA